MLAAFALAAVQPVYPAELVIRELKSVCSIDYRSAKRAGFIGPASDAIVHWASEAGANGWTLIESDTPNLSRRDVSASGRIESLNHLLFGSFAMANDYASVPTEMLGGQVFRKDVAGRTLYLSVFGADDGARTVGECRIHDLLGDGVQKNPIASPVVEQVFGAKPKTAAGAFGSTAYSWQAGKGRIGYLEVHFGFGGWKVSSFNKRIENFNPYAPYGLTMVMGFRDQVIII
ncbi:MAG TPA: hypothetical protein VGN68_05880 [Sphingopyxis sp.]|jgi:hypothetical protein|uniref:hypothetical protein n=1 Tax=Sphingopyxis sp. TaxID=1908224 RepID=UPI002E143C39|nr:hypothetical protein [Sphingopyxis sp.]